MATPEAEAFYDAVYTCVRLIPYGRVTTYGHIAKLIDAPRNSRQVGQALKYLPADQADVPWHRVISSSGKISPRERMEGAREQAAILREEGVEVVDVGMDERFEGGGGGKVSLGVYGWFPEVVDLD
ncbi:DNA binding methylated-DNA--cysteine S-methyltransferase [Saitoella complicata NRRL Y-17804]|uniref:DNA binding methylated-DNA--cysteine S-methyltransferase n=1 Tax=Saitoella complicata (strain BCRC 22490 / CBS 7301 / JCM 7358 / NBRC 10748 / NRRL Y-17804) TaxID=698492 RepID=UPI000867DB0D|nr:DNA binding methylated-DNA--cysteine S-methyltransferase [Saitoella complicata NRRL Y-17804]ODQ51352.1 DNA binding methylated-DNA--cysteine S-methyltransferase [Saitoella complicata NRRL Y-17804]